MNTIDPWPVTTTLKSWQHGHQVREMVLVLQQQCYNNRKIASAHLEKLVLVSQRTDIVHIR